MNCVPTSDCDICIQKPSGLHPSPNCLHSISNINIYIQLSHAPQIVGSIYPIQQHIFINVHFPTLCPKGTQKPSELAFIPQLFLDVRGFIFWTFGVWTLGAHFWTFGVFGRSGFGVFGHSGFGVSFLHVRGVDVGGPFLDVGGFRTFGVGGFWTFGVGGSFMAGQGWESR